MRSAEPTGAVPLRGRRSVLLAALAVAAVIPVCAWVVARGGQSSAHRGEVLPATVAGRAERYADRVVESYAERQRADGSFPDPVQPSRGDYGTAMLGLAMAERGTERRDQRLVAGGVRAIAFQARTSSAGAFELLALARAYRWADRTLLGDPFSAPIWSGARGGVADALRHRSALTANPSVDTCLSRPTCYGNQKLVAALAAATLLSTALKADKRQALLAGPEGLERLQRELLDQLVNVATSTLERTGASAIDDATVLSDPPQNPLAYHALSTWMLGQLLDERPDDASTRVGRDAFGRAARGLLALASPEGDLSYYGRGQGQLWVPAVTVAAAAQIVRRAPSRRERAQALAVADAALRRLERLYRVSDSGVDLLPGARTARELADRRYDSYAGSRVYAGLAVQALNDAARSLRRARPLPRVALPAATSGSTADVRKATDTGGLSVATMTRGDTWVAIALSARKRADARYGPGVLEFRRRIGFEWVDVVPPMPMQAELLPAVAAHCADPLLVPRGTAVKVRSASFVARGTWRTLDGEDVAPGRWAWELDEHGRLRVEFAAPCNGWVVSEARVLSTGAIAETREHEAIADDGRVAWTLTAPRGATAGSPRRLGPSAYGGGAVGIELSAAVRRGDLVRLTVDAAR